MFNTIFSKHEHFFSRSGSGVKPDLVLQTDKNGVQYLKKVGEINVYDRIQSFADSVDIHVLIKRFLSGDDSVLSQRVANYFDASEMPDNLAEIFNMVNNGRYLFDSLPVDVKSQFNNNFSEFVSSIGTDKFISIFSPKSDKVDTVVSEKSEGGVLNE